MATFQEHKNKTASEKIVLAWLEPSQRLFAWSVHSGSVYKRTAPYYVVGVRQAGTALVSVASLAAVNGAGKWYFDPATRDLYVWATGSVDPTTVWTDVTYRLFYSNAPIDLSATLAVGGTEVPYDARLKKTSKFKAKFDPDQKGIALEGTGKLTLHNRDGAFAPIYDLLVWENKRARIFSYARDLPLSEAVTLFDGVVTNKDYDDDAVSFDVKDVVYKLRSELDLPVFTDDDGTLPKSILGKPKRRVYGRVDGLLCAPVDTMGTAYQLQTITGDVRSGTALTVSLTQGSNIATCSSADVHKELCAGDTLTVNGNKLKVKSMSRIDFGLDSEKEVTVSIFSAGVVKLEFTGIDTTNVATSMHITLSGLANASQDTKKKLIGHFVVGAVTSTYICITVAGVSSLSDVFKTSTGEIAITRNTDAATFTLQQVSPITVSSAVATVTPAVPYRRFNRQYVVAHHALSTRETEITAVISGVKFALANVDGVYEGDFIRIAGGDLSEITGLDRVGKLVTVADTVLPLPQVFDTVERLGIQRATFAQKDFTQFEDFNPGFGDSGSTLDFDTLAEFNVANDEQLTSQTSWRYGSKQVLGSNSVFRDLKVRDWIQVGIGGTWFEIAEKFSDNLVILNTSAFATTAFYDTFVRRPTYLADTSKVIAEVYGKTEDDTESGTLISTAAEVVRDLMIEAGVGDLIDEDAFALASEKAPYRISMALPETVGGNAPVIRSVINTVNDSVIGSLYTGIDGFMRYQVLDATRTVDDAVQLDDTDIIGYSVASDSTAILRKVLVRFNAKDADTVTEAETYSVAQAESVRVENSGVDGQVETYQTVLYDRTQAETLAARVVFIREMASNQVAVTVKLQLADATLNSLVNLDLDRLFRRFGTPGVDCSKTGLISAIEKDGLNVKATVDDLGNLFNRVGVIAPNSCPEFGDSEERDRRFAGYITDDNGLMDDGEDDTFNANLIG